MQSGTTRDDQEGSRSKCYVRFVYGEKSWIQALKYTVHGFKLSD